MATKAMKWRDVLAQAREALRQAVAQAEEAGVDASRGHFVLEQMPYFERALEMAPEGLRQGMAEKMAQREVAMLDLQMGVSQDTILRSLGYDPALEREKQALTSQDTAEALLQAFDRGEGEA